MRIIWKSATVLLILCVLLFTMCTGAWAALDLQHRCTITVKFDPQKDHIPADAVVDFYQIASAELVDGYDAYTLNYNNYYTGLDFDLNDESKWFSLAQAAAKITFESGVTAFKSDQNIEAQIEVNAGLYLLIIHGAGVPVSEYYYEQTDEDGITTITTKVVDTNSYYYFFPMLIAVPQLGAEWVYDVDISVKPDDHKNTDVPDVTIEKVDEETGAVLPDAKFKLYGAVEPADPTTNTDTIKVYVEGMGEVVLYFQPASNAYADEHGYYVTDENGKANIPSPKPTEVPPYTLYALKEVEAPEGYELLEDPIFFYFEGGEVDGVYFDSRGVSDNNFEGGLIWKGNGVHEYPYKIFVFKNSSDEDVFVRIKAHIYCVSPVDDESEPDVDEFVNFFSYDDGWDRYTGDIFEFNRYLQPGEETSDFRVQLPPGYNIILEYETAPVIYDDSRPPSADWGNPNEPYPVDYKYQAKVLQDGTITVEDPPAPVAALPEVGGTGTAVFDIVGGMMTAIGLILLAFKKRMTN